MGKAFRVALTTVLVLVAALLLLTLFNLFAPSTPGRRSTQEVAYSEVLDLLNKDEIREVVMMGNHLYVELKPGISPGRVHAYMPSDANLVPQLAAHTVRIVARPDDDSDNLLLRHALSWAPFLLLLGIILYIGRRIVSALNRIHNRLETLREGKP